MWNFDNSNFLLIQIFFWDFEIRIIWTTRNHTSNNLSKADVHVQCMRVRQELRIAHMTSHVENRVVQKESRAVFLATPITTPTCIPSKEKLDKNKEVEKRQEKEKRNKK